MHFPYLILDRAPFQGFTPDDMTNWLNENSDGFSLAEALASVSRRAGILMHELNESDDPWLAYSYDQWRNVEKYIYSAIREHMLETNRRGATNYDFNIQGQYYIVKPFMEQHGFRDGGGWWVKC